MPLYLLDTDHISLMQYNNAQVMARYAQMLEKAYREEVNADPNQL